MNDFIFWTVYIYMPTYKGKDSWTEVNYKYNKYTDDRCRKESTRDCPAPLDVIKSYLSIHL